VPTSHDRENTVLPNGGTGKRDEEDSAQMNEEFENQLHKE